MHIYCLFYNSCLEINFFLVVLIIFIFLAVTVVPLECILLLHRIATSRLHCRVCYFDRGGWGSPLVFVVDDQRRGDREGSVHCCLLATLAKKTGGRVSSTAAAAAPICVVGKKERKKADFQTELETRRHHFSNSFSNFNIR